MVQIIDGNCSEPNIFADDIGQYNISMWGSGDFVLPVGEQLGYELVSNNEITIKDGLFMTQGRRGVIKKGTTETCVIENGTQAENRIDLIVMEYACDASTALESHAVKVVKGTPGTEAVEPEVITGDITKGDLFHQMPLYRVRLEGLNVVSVEQLFTVGKISPETVDPSTATKGGLAADAKLTGELIAQQNVNIDNLSSQMQSFENTKSEIVGSGLGSALSLTASTTWANIVSKIKGVITKLSGSTTIAADKMGWDSTNHLWCYIPVNAFYSTVHWLKLENANVAAKIGLTAAKIVTGNTILGIAGTNKGYDAGYAAGQAAPIYKTGSFQSGYSNGDTVTINVGFKPSVVIIKANDASCLAACDSRIGINHVMAVGNNTPGTITVNSSGFVFTSITNFANRSCKYIAYK